jgi:ribosomal protein S18 acetylase RimI-like enzyme
MATIGADDLLMHAHSSTGNLPLVRRLEAVGFRAWPASSVQYDGSWQVRLTAGHPSKRLNCVVALDPADCRDVAIRLEKAKRKFEAYGRPMVVRETPLAPPQLMDLLRRQSWQSFEETVVMVADLSAIDLPGTMDHLPSHDVGRYVDAYLRIEQADLALKPALAEVVSKIKPPSGLFVIEEAAAGPVAASICVQDNDLAGLLSLVVAADHRRRGLGMEVLASSLRWARMRSAKTAWLQVTVTNGPAVSLYRRVGFREGYRYRYWRPEPEA